MYSLVRHLSHFYLIVPLNFEGSTRLVNTSTITGSVIFGSHNKYSTIKTLRRVTRALSTY